jgi:hypothetical protein
LVTRDEGRIIIASQQGMPIMMPIVEEQVPTFMRPQRQQRRRLGWFITLVDAVKIGREALIERAQLELSRLGVEVEFDAVIVNSHRRRDLAVSNFLSLIVSVEIDAEVFALVHERLERLGWLVSLEEVQDEGKAGALASGGRSLAVRN